MSNYAPHENEALGELAAKIEEAIEKDTDNFNELSDILGLSLQTDFAEGNLSKFDLQKASFTDADLNHTRFDQTNLKDANLKNANLTGANLSNADLTNADLTEATLIGANLKDSNLTGVKVSKEQLKGVDLTHAIGLTPEMSQLLEERDPSKIYTPLSDSELKSLVEAFCCQQQDTPTGKIATYKLLRAIHRLPKLNRNYQPFKKRFQGNFELVLYETLLEIIKQICQEFEADETDYIQSLTYWVNYKLRFTYNPEKKLQKVSQDKTFSLEEYSRQLIDKDENSSFLALLENYEDGETLSSIDALIKKAQQERKNEKRF